MNDILYYKPCTAEDAASNQTKGSGTTGGSTGGPCGEQGYANGARNSEANKKQIWDFLKSKGLSDTAAAGIMGNMEQESAFMPDAVNSLGCSGIVQWCFGRNDQMRQWATENGRDWTCLGSQLDFMWHEVTETGESGVMDKLNAAKTPQEAADAWADGYERMKPDEKSGRADRAAEIYKEFTGQSAPSAATTKAAAGDSCPATTTAASNSNANSLSGDCKANVDKINQLESQGKIVFTDQKAKEDVQNCGKVASCSGGNGGGGIAPNTAKALAGLAEQSGVSQVKVSALNSDHECDGGEHPKGLAIDLAYAQGDAEGQKAYKYLYDNAKDLGVNKLIWGTVDQPGWTPMPGYQCMYGGQPIDCYNTYSDDRGGGGNHIDHIHVSMMG
jgi:hypothetical protein